MDGQFPDRKVPLTDEQIAKLREESIQSAWDGYTWVDCPWIDEEPGFTCDGCPRGEYKRVCPFIFDLYNTDGDCLAMK